MATFLRGVILTWIIISIHYFGFAAGEKGLVIYKQNPADTFETHLKNSLVSHYQKYPQEKVFVHTNQAVYSGGQTIWYKVYTMAYGKPSVLSKIIYVRLTDTAGNLIVQNKLALTDGQAHGNFDLNIKIKSGWYRLSAFTAWMMNFGKDAYYNQLVYIRSPEESSTPLVKQGAKKTYHVLFYPEGGDIIAGNLTTIAFKAFSDDGLPAQIEGEVKDNAKKLISKLIPAHDGMGNFALEALPGAVYNASATFPDGSRQEVKLPPVLESGISFQANQGLSAVHLKLAYSGPKDKYEYCTLAAFQNNGQVITCSLHLLKGTNLFDLPKEDFSTGIIRLTIFSAEGIPQAERILFIDKHDLHLSAFKMDTLSFSPKGGNVFSAILKDKLGMPVNGKFSIAITDGDAFGIERPGQNIFSALLLSPELKGEINDPAYYFKNESDSLAQQLDLVMQTNGWRHFTWTSLLNNEIYPIKYPVEKSQYISGKILGYKSEAEDARKFTTKLLIMNQDSSKFLGNISPDINGSFILNNFNHSGQSDIYSETSDKKNHIKKLPIKIFPTLADSLKQVKSPPFTFETTPVFPAHYISLEQNETKFSLANGILLKTVNIKDTKVSPTDELIKEHVSAKYQSTREFTLDLVNNPTVDIGVIDYIRGKFTNLQIEGNYPNLEFVYRGGNSLFNSSSPGVSGLPLPYFYLNEAPITLDDVVNNTSLYDVALIRFMPPPVWFAPYNGGTAGAIMIYTRKQSDEVRKMTGSSDFDHFVFNGYSVTREFNAPDYSKPENAKVVDNRITLYWNHDLNTDINGVLKFKFYNSDRAKKFNIIIQGMDADGRLVYFEQSVQ